MSQSGNDRAVTRCRHCHLNQFVTANGNCRKCRHSLAPEPVKDAQPVAIAPDVQANQEISGICFAMKLVRLANMMSQAELAKRAGISRAYISRIENGVAPKLINISKIADALDCEIFRLIQISQVAA